MPASKPFQYSLRTYLLGCAIAALVVAALVWRFQAYERWQRSISRVGGSAGFGGFNASYDNFQLTHYKDRQGRPVAYVLLNFDANGPTVPAITRNYRYSASTGGVLTVDGQRIDPADAPLLFVNGPYGFTVRLKMTEADVAEVESFQWLRGQAEPCLHFWRQRVEPQIYKVAGESVAEQRNGRWTYRLANDALYLEADYMLGERHGDWTTYYPDGSVMCRAHFEEGKPSGHWEYFDQAGGLVAAVHWQRSFPVNFENQRGGGGSRGSYLFSGEQDRKTGYVLSETDGGRFFLEGNEFPRPPLNFPLRTDGQP